MCVCQITDSYAQGSRLSSPRSSPRGRHDHIPPRKISLGMSSPRVGCGNLDTMPLSSSRKGSRTGSPLLFRRASSRDHSLERVGSPRSASPRDHSLERVGSPGLFRRASSRDNSLEGKALISTPRGGTTALRGSVDFHANSPRDQRSSEGRFSPLNTNGDKGGGNRRGSATSPRDQSSDGKRLASSPIEAAMDGKDWLKMSRSSGRHDGAPVVHDGVLRDGRLVELPHDLTNLCAKVADFGMSREAAFSSHFKDSTVDNPTWTAPEIILKQMYTAKVDVYSFGVILWEMFARKIPFGEMQFMAQVEKAVTEGKRPDFPPNCPGDYCALITMCWAQVTIECRA